MSAFGGKADMKWHREKSPFLLIKPRCLLDKVRKPNRGDAQTTPPALPVPTGNAVRAMSR